MMLIFYLLALLAPFFSASDSAQHTSSPPKKIHSAPIAKDDSLSIEITYIANEGVLISSKDQQVLIDGLHRNSNALYQAVPAKELAKLEGAQSPYDAIDILLVSHIHRDHYHSQSLALHLRNNSNAVLMSSPQAVDGVLKKIGEQSELKERIKAVTPAWKSTIELVEKGFEIKFLGLRHGSKRFRDIQNLGHVITLGEKKLLHIGDADMSVENFKSFDLQNEKIDIAFIPYWFLLYDDGKKIVRELIKPDHIIVVHISLEDIGESAQKIKKDFPGATIFRTPMQSVKY